MSGIHRYYHGETGIVRDIWWLAGKERLSYVAFLENNQYRKLVQDYGSDIGIAPFVEKNDEVIYVRMNPWAGIWTRKDRVSGEDIKSGEEGVIEYRKYMDEYNGIAGVEPEHTAQWLESLYQQTGIPVYQIEQERVFGAAHAPKLDNDSPAAVPPGRRPTDNYPYLFSDNGIAVRLQWKKKNNRIYWVLYYKEKKYSLKIKKVMGDKKNHVVDSGIRPGDKIGLYMLDADTPVWMRTEKLDHTPDQLYNQYQVDFTIPPVPGPLSKQSARARKLMLTAGWVLIIGSAFGLFQLIRYLTGKIERPPELTLDQFQLILNANIILFFASVLIYGFYSLQYHGHRMQFEWRTGWHTVQYCIESLGVVVWDTVCKPLVFFFGISILYTIPAIILLHGLRQILEISVDTAFSYGHIGIYFLWIIYIGWRFWRLFVEGPDYVYEPSFAAGYTEGIGRPRRS